MPERLARRLRGLGAVLAHPNTVAALGCYTVSAFALSAWLGAQAFALVGLALLIDIAITHRPRRPGA